MAGKADPSRMACVIGLLPAGSVPIISGLTTDGFFRLVRVGSGYEAAAELLAEPASALLVDLSMLTVRHKPLLKLAGKLNVPVVAFGTVSSAIDGSALAGIHLVGAEQAGETLRNLVTGEVVAEPAAGPPAAEEPPCMFDKPLTREELDALLSD